MDRSECRILTIDDEKELTDIVTALLQREQYSQVDVAGSCSEAKEKLRKHHYDLILLDVMLPDGNGFDFYAERLLTPFELAMIEKRLNQMIYLACEVKVEEMSLDQASKL